MVATLAVKSMTRMMVGAILLATMKARPAVTVSTATAASASAFAQRYTSSGSTTTTVRSALHSATPTSAAGSAVSSSTRRTLSYRSSFCGTTMRIQTIQRPTKSTERIRSTSFSSSTIVMMPEGPEVCFVLAACHFQSWDGGCLCLTLMSLYLLSLFVVY